jgi:hypothetical protein
MKRIVIGALLAAASSAFADDIRLGNPIYGGTGCPQGTASAVLSPDRKTLSVLFDGYMAEAGYTTGRSLDRKSCNLAIPVHVPQGMSVALLRMDYRGFNDLPMGTTSRLSVDYFFAGARGPNSTRTFRGPTSDNYLVSDHLSASSLVWSPCGADTNLRINSSLMVQTNSHYDQAIATVDSADIQGGIVYQIQWRTCR